MNVKQKPRLDWHQQVRISYMNIDNLVEGVIFATSQSSTSQIGKQELESDQRYITNHSEFEICTP